jgi:dihydroxyacetone kinase-like protein
MKKIINRPDEYTMDMLKGIYAAHGNVVTHVNNDLHCYYSLKKKKGKVGIITGGGTGHLPLFLGYIGEGMLDGCAVGDVFQSPSAEQIFEISKEVESGGGILYLYGNYTGDIMNFDMALEFCQAENIKAMSLTGSDDVCSAQKGNERTRRGVAGIFYQYKCAGAAADQLASLEEVYTIAKEAGDRIRTAGFALTPCILPEIGKPNFILSENEMAMGMGIHGEPGIWNGPLKTSEEIVNEILGYIIEDMPIMADEEVSVLINGLGSTPLDELYILYNDVNAYLKVRGIIIDSAYVGEFATSMEMSGASISLFLLNDKFKKLLHHPANTPFFKQI